VLPESTHAVPLIRDSLQFIVLGVLGWLIWRRARSNTDIARFLKMGLPLAAGLMLADFTGLSAVADALRIGLYAGVVAMLLIIAPELRRAFRARAVGHDGHKTRMTHSTPEEEITSAATHLAGEELGGLIAIERRYSLEEFVDTGIRLDAQLSRELLVAIFTKNSPLHDGGVILRGESIVAAATLFPVSDRPDLPNSFGLRHRAAIRLSEETDATVIVVSEETGKISFVEDGSFHLNISPSELLEHVGKSMQKSGQTPSKKSSTPHLRS
jgi:diadenylate cyclase